MGDKYITEYTEQTTPGSSAAFLVDEGSGAYKYVQQSNIFSGANCILGDGIDLIGSATSDITINTNKFTVAGATGNTVIGGTLGLTGDLTNSAGDFVVANEHGLRASSSDGSDNFTVKIAGGGGFTGRNRGAFIELTGNEAGGDINYTAGTGGGSVGTWGQQRFYAAGGTLLLTLGDASTDNDLSAIFAGAVSGVTTLGTSDFITVANTKGIGISASDERIIFGTGSNIDVIGANLTVQRNGSYTRVGQAADITLSILSDPTNNAILYFGDSDSGTQGGLDYDNNVSTLRVIAAGGTVGTFSSTGLAMNSLAVSGVTTLGMSGTLTNTTGGIIFPSSDPGVAGAWWDNAGTLTKSAG